MQPLPADGTDSLSPIHDACRSCNACLSHTTLLGRRWEAERVSVHRRRLAMPMRSESPCSSGALRIPRFHSKGEWVAQFL